MLAKISFRNARRQFSEYLLFFITLICSISFIYAFNALVFSDSIKSLSGMDILPYMIVITSIFIVIILAWIITYMTNYMLKQRSKEFGIYMISGITPSSIHKLFFYENLCIGIFAFLVGIPFGVLLSEIIEAILKNIYNVNYMLSFTLSLPTVGLTFLYYILIFIFSLYKNGRWIKRLRLYELLYINNQNERPILNDKNHAIKLFILVFLLFIATLIVLIAQPIGKGFDNLFGMIFLAIAVMCFFAAIPATLITAFSNKNNWKYKKNHLIIFRSFSSKINSLSKVMGLLSIIFMLSITLFGTAISASIIAHQSMKLNPFDILILSKDIEPNFSKYNNSIEQITAISGTHTYNIYTSDDTTFLSLRDDAISNQNNNTSQSIYSEFLNDTYIKQSDYKYLRQILGYSNVSLQSDSVYIHCISALETDFKNYFNDHCFFDISNISLKAGEVFSEPFAQNDAYGNGLDYIVIIPDFIANNLETLYSLCAIVTTAPLTTSNINSIIINNDDLVILNRNTIKSTNTTDGTSIFDNELYYLSGKWAQEQTFSQLYTLLICLFYLGIILEIAGAAVLATQISSNKNKRRYQNKILIQLGMSKKQAENLYFKHLILIFVFPLLPALFISSTLIYYYSGKMEYNAYNLTIFNNSLWKIQSIVVSIILFLLLYIFYYIFTYLHHKQEYD